MSLLTRLARNSLWLLIARMGAQLSLVIVTYLLARRLGPVGFGEYAFIAAAIVIGNTLTTFGSDMYLIREIASKSDFSELLPVLILQLLLSLLFIGFTYLLAPYFPNQTSESLSALKVFSFALIPLAFFTVFTSMLRGAQKMTEYALLNFVIPVLQVIAVFIFIQRGTGIAALAYLLLGIQTLAAILSGVFCFFTFPGFWNSLHFSADKLFSLFKACLPIALIAILGIFYQKMSLTMLSFLGPASTVGLFSAAARIVEAARMGHAAVFTALYPAMANADQNRLSHKTFRLSWFLLMAISAGSSVLLFLLAKPIVDIFFGTDYRMSIPVLQILVFTLIPYTVNTYLLLMFLARKKEWLIIQVLTVSLIVLLILNLWFIPSAGQVGAGWAILIAEAAQAVLFLLAWMNSPFRQIDALQSKGVSYELSDLS
jgi:O-antigen/teichoic acid export membrane protein